MAKKVELSEQEIQNIKNLYENEFLSSRKIATQTSFSRNVIERIIREYNFSKKEKPEPFPWLTKELLLKLYEKEKKGIEKIAQELKVSKHVIKRYLKKYNIQIRERNETSRVSIDSNELYNFYVSQKLPIKEIAKYYGCTEGTIIKRLKKHKIPLRTSFTAVNGKESLITELYKKGMSIKEIEKETNTSYDIIKSFLIQQGLMNYSHNVSINIEDIKTLFIEGVPVRKIASKYGCCNNTIQRILKASKLTRKNKKGVFSNVPYEILYNLIIDQHKSKEDISALYGVTKQTVSRRLEELNIRIIHKQQDITKSELENLYFNEKMTQQEIADYFKTCRSTISHLFQKYGIRKKFKTDGITKEFLIKHYVKENLPPCEIAKKFNLDVNAIKKKIYRLNLKSLKTPKQIAECQAKVYNRTLSNSSSKDETEIRNLFPTKFHNVSDIIGLELDLWYPEKKFAIEYNGDYWHSLKFHRNSGLHLAKMEICENKGIHLINIFERDWQSRTRKKIEEHIKKILYPEQMKTVNQYNCKIMNVGEYTQFHFERRCNLLNYEKSDHCVGLYDARVKNSVSYNIRNNICEIIRFTTEFGYAEEYKCLIEYIKRKHKLPIILTYDKRYYSSEFAIKLGFEPYKEIKPEIYYVRNRKAFRKNELTEEELAKNRYLEVYDCGSSQWILK